MKIQDLTTKSRFIEKELISRLINNEGLIPQAMSLVIVDDFSNYSNVFSVITNSFKNSKNLITEFSTNKLKLSDFIEDVSFRRIDLIANELKEVSNAIRLYKILEDSLHDIPSENIESYISDIQRQIITKVKDTQKEKTDINSIIKEYQERKEFYQEKYKNGDKIIGISTGYDKLDEIIDGIRPQHLWVIGGYTNSGKTAASLNLVASLIQQGKRVVYYSLEMGNTDILARLIGIMANDNGLSILKGFPKDQERVNTAIQTIKKSNLSIHTTKSNLSEIQYSMYEENLKEHVDLFVVDFLQLVTVKGAKSEYETINASSLEFQQMAKRLKSTVLLLSQISNDGARNANDIVMSFKGSGSIAAAADLAIEITIGEQDKETWKQKMHNGEPVLMNWNIRKNRHGRIGFIQMAFEGKTGVFALSELESF